MTTTRFDHTDCSHDATPAGRKACRARRLADIKKLQAEFMACCDDRELIAEYEAGVDIFSMRWGMALRDAYELIENGPVVH